MTSAPQPPIPLSVLFVCLGNICRSTMAEGVFRSLMSSAPQPPSARYILTPDRIDSAGTGAYHQLSPPDPRTMDVLATHGITTYSHSARKVKLQDFENFDYILAMDGENLQDLQYERRRALRAKQKRDPQAGIVGSTTERGTRKSTRADHLRDLTVGKAPDGLAYVMLFGAFGGSDPEEEVDDPYYGGRNGFEIAYKQLDRFSCGFLKWLEAASLETDSS